MLGNIIRELKELPHIWIICLTILLSPLTMGLGLKVYNTAEINYKKGDTEINLKQIAKENDLLFQEQNEKIDELTQAIKTAQEAARNKKINLPGLRRVKEVVEEAEEINKDLTSNNEELQDLIIEESAPPP